MIVDPTGRARKKFETLVETGKAQAETLIEKLHTELPVDVLAPASKLEAVVAETQIRLRNPAFEYDLHRNARSQLFTKLGFPTKYADDLLTNDADWSTGLLERNLNELLQHDTSRYLIRSVNDQARGFLSDRYRRLDARPILDAVIEASAEYGTIPISGIVSDLSFALKLALPTVYEALPGQPFVYWEEFKTSNYGLRKVSVSNGLTVLVCLNGATMDEIFGQRHIGKEMPEDIQLSAETMRLDTAWTVSAMKDVVKATLNPANVETLCQKVRNANDKKLDSKTFVERVKSLGLNKGETEKAETLYGLGDVEFLPPGDTYWRASNVISHMAVNTNNADRRLELEEIAGDLLRGFQGNRSQIAA